jgi:hypothetical protein
MGFDPTPKWLDSRLLLGYAVDSATPIKDWAGVNKPDFSTWIDLFEDAFGNLIVWVIKGTQQHSTVEDVVVDV